MTTFHSYDPATRSHQAQPKACEACYARKVRCDFADGSLICRNCSTQNAECRPRTRKRKAPSIDPHGSPNVDVNTNLKRRNTETGAAATQQPSERPNSRSPSGRNGSRSVQRMKLDDLAAPFLFIGQRNALASSPGTTAEAMASSIDEFHNSSFLSRSAVLGDDFANIDHSHTDPQKPFKLSPTELQVLRLYHAFDLPELPLRQSLIEAFSEYSWTWMPVVDVSSLSAALPSSETSLLLLQAVLLAGALMRPEVCDKPTLDSHYQRVKALVNSSYERNPLNILAALCLIQWYTPTAPKDISTDTPRFWESCALGIAQQIGLHQQPKRKTGDYGLRRRIWWTLYTRDSLMAAAHGRPRMISIADSTMDPISVEDFDDPTDVKAQIFVSYAGTTEVLYDLCSMLIRQTSLTNIDRGQLASRLLEKARALPPHLRLHNLDGSQRPYNFEVAQLHVPLLTMIAILHRPQSVFNLAPTNAASITAANLIYRIFQAIQLRQQTRQLSSAFAWFLLVAAMPHLSCLRVPALQFEANAALDTLEDVLQTLGTVRPAAANNLKNVRAIRKAVNSRDPAPLREPKADGDQFHNADRTNDPATVDILSLYGSQAIRNLENVTKVLTHPPSMDDQGAVPSESGDLDPPIHADGERAVQSQAANDDGQSSLPDFEYDFGEGFPELFGEHFQENTWMRNWIDDLQPFPD